MIQLEMRMYKPSHGNENANGNDLSGVGSNGNAIVPKIDNLTVFVRVSYFVGIFELLLACL